MTTEQFITALRQRLAANRQPVDRANRYEFVRGWNECEDFVEREIKKLEGEGAKAA